VGERYEDAQHSFEEENFLSAIMNMKKDSVVTSAPGSMVTVRDEQGRKENLAWATLRKVLIPNC